jgi:hypothetical protein
MQGLLAGTSNNIFSNNHLAGCSDGDLEQAYIVSNIMNDTHKILWKA